MVERKHADVECFPQYRRQRADHEYRRRQCDPAIGQQRHRSWYCRVNGGGISTSGAVSLFYNPANNPGNGTINASSCTDSTNYSIIVSGGATLAAYMLVNNIYDLQNIQNNLSGTYALGAKH